MTWSDLSQECAVDTHTVYTTPANGMLVVIVHKQTPHTTHRGICWIQLGSQYSHPSKRVHPCMCYNSLMRGALQHGDVVAFFSMHGVCVVFLLPTVRAGEGHWVESAMITSAEFCVIVCRSNLLPPATFT